MSNEDVPRPGRAVSENERALRVIAKLFDGIHTDNLGSARERHVCCVLVTHEFLTIDEDQTLITTKDVREALELD